MTLQPARSRSAVAGAMAVLSMALVTGLAVWTGREMIILAAGVIVLVTVMAVVFPRAATVAYLMLGWLPAALAWTTYLPEGWDIVGGTGVTIGDVILTGMAIAVAVRLARNARAGGSARRVALVFVGFVGWCLVEVLRNVDAYGLAAFGEYRAYYLPVIGGAYVALYFQDAAHRRWMQVALLVLTCLVPLLLIPVIGLNKGWGIGPDSRFLQPVYSLGFVYGLIFMYVRHRDGLRVPPRVLTVPLATIAVGEVLADGYRAVWLAAAAAVLTVTLLRSASGRRNWQLVMVIVLTMGLVIAFAGFVGLDVGSYFASRSNAFVDPSSDVTSLWRLSTWKAATSSAAASQPFGLGFGAYWNLYVPELGGTVTVFPHNMYVMTLVKTGLIGLMLWAWLMVEVGRQLFAAWKHRVDYSLQDATLVGVGLVALVSSAAYQVAYGVAETSLLWVGLGLAAAIGGHSATRRGGVDE